MSSVFLLTLATAFLFGGPPVLGLKLCVQDTVQSECNQLRQLSSQIQCVFARDTMSCIHKVYTQQADVVLAEGQEVYTAGRFYNLAPIAYVYENHKPYKYRAAALVRSNLNINKLADLKGLKSCHTGVGRTAGWKVPLSVLSQETSLPVDCRGDLFTMTNIFSKSCAPGDWVPDKDLDKQLKKKHQKLCDQCASDCSRKDPFLGYAGALKCLSSGKGDIVFTTLEAILEYFNADQLRNYRLLCKNGTLANVTERSACLWAHRPTAAFLALSNDQRIPAFANDLEQLFPRYGSSPPDYLLKIMPQLKNATNITRTTGMNNRYQTYLGDFLKTIDFNYRACTPKTKRFCAPSSPAMLRCEEFSKVAQGRHLRPQLECVKGNDKKDCVEKVRKGQADIVVIEGSHVYVEGRYHNFKTVLQESYNDSKASYYAVAVVRENSKVKNFSKLKGARSCHPEMNMTSGWIVPVGVLFEKGMLSKHCDRALAMSQFFNGSCAPGANSTKYNPHLSGAQKLCQQCIGDLTGRSKCTDSFQETYYYLPGALRCLVEGKGDVAFVKHSTLSEVFNPRSSYPWARNVRSANFRLICPDSDKTYALQDYEKCHLAKVPPRVIALSSQTEPNDLVEVARLFSQASKLFGQDSSIFHLFGPFQNRSDVLFMDNTKALKLVSLKGDYKDALPKDFLRIVQRSDPYKCINSAAGEFVPNLLATLLISLALLFIKSF